VPAGAHGSAGYSQGSAGLSFCVLVAISPRRAGCWGGVVVVPRGMRPADTPRRPPPLAPRRWARGRSPIGYRAPRSMPNGFGITQVTVYIILRP
jgi:hypothetical protein